MVAPPNQPARGAASNSMYFDPRVKCCTYTPPLPNFLVGRVLLDADPQMAAGRASVMRRIASRREALPLGLEVPPTFVLLYGAGGTATFGQSIDLLCPHYLSESGGCGIWRHRQGVCATWFCKFNRGEVGLQFWQALLHLLRTVERALAVYCVRTLAPGAEAARHAAASRTPTAVGLTPADLGGPSPTVELERQWGRYAGRETDFYEACARLVETMSWEDVRRAGGAEVDLAADVAADAYRRLLANQVPAVLRVGTLAITPIDEHVVECTAYGGHDPLVVPKALIDVLHVFDGRTTAHAIAAARKAGVELDRAVVRRLVDFGVLADAGSERRATR